MAIDCLLCHAARQNVQCATAAGQVIAPAADSTPAAQHGVHHLMLAGYKSLYGGKCVRAAGRTPVNAGAGVRVVHALLAANLRAQVPPVSLHNMAPHVPAPMDPQQTEEMNLRVMTRIDPATEEVRCANVIPAPVSCSHAIREGQPRTIGTSATKSQCCHRTLCCKLLMCPGATVSPVCLQILAAVGHVALYEFNTSGQTWVRVCRGNLRSATLPQSCCRHVCCRMPSPKCGLCRRARMSKAPYSFSGGGPCLYISSRS